MVAHDFFDGSSKTLSIKAPEKGHLNRRSLDGSGRIRGMQYSLRNVQSMRLSRTRPCSLHKIAQTCFGSYVCTYLVPEKLRGMDEEIERASRTQLVDRVGHALCSVQSRRSCLPPNPQLKPVITVMSRTKRQVSTVAHTNVNIYALDVGLPAFLRDKSTTM